MRNYGIFIVLMKTGQFADKTGGFYLRDIEPILFTATPEQPATLKIEEGKFYKTRDGRKVGPIVVAQGRGNPWPWKSRYGLNIYFFKEDGFSCPGSAHLHRDADDIVAEWIDETATAKPSNDNAKPKFKVGDRVRIVKHCNYKGESIPLDLPVGSEHAIVKVGGTLSYLGCDTYELSGGGLNFYVAQNLELVPSPDTTAIVALIENGQPKPSSTPHVHASTGAAEKEAKRLAAKHKGQQFGVFTLTATHEEAAPVYDHKWQNLAALGLKIDAIKELRSITGMGLKPAKDAVEYFFAAA